MTSECPASLTHRAGQASKSSSIKEHTMFHEARVRPRLLPTLRLPRGVLGMSSACCTAVASVGSRRVSEIRAKGSLPGAHGLTGAVAGDAGDRGADHLPRRREVLSPV